MDDKRPYEGPIPGPIRDPRDEFEDFARVQIRQKLAELLAEANGEAEADRERVASIERAIAKRWGEALRLFGVMFVEADQRLLMIWSELAGDDALWTKKSEALTSLVRRCCYTAREIHALLRSGLSVGAQARWRTLHELATVVAFIHQNGDDVAERYVASERIEAWKAWNEVELIRKAGNDVIASARMTPSEAQDLTDEYVDLKKKYDGIAEDWGWAAGAVKGRPTFVAIREKVAPKAPMKQAHAAVHAGAGSSFWTREPGAAYRPPSDVALVAPGGNSPRELRMAFDAYTEHLIAMTSTSIPAILWAVAFAELCDHVAAAFTAAAADGEP